MSCDAKIRPFPNPTELTCERTDAPHDEHGATLRDYAYPGSETVITWQESDRRTFRGAWRPCETTMAGGCVLPADHRGRHVPMSTTSDPNDPRLGRGVDDEPRGMNEAYLVLSEDERAKGFLRPVRRSYVHTVCGTVTTMGQAIAETYARDPWFYGATFCVHCSMHRPVGADGEFVWNDGSKVGT